MCVVSLASIVGGKQKDWCSMKFIIPCSVSNVEVIWDSRRSIEVDEKLLWPKHVKTTMSGVRTTQTDILKGTTVYTNLSAQSHDTFTHAYT